MRTRDALLAAALVGAYASFARTFRGPRERFWQRMTEQGVALGALALAAQPELRRPRITPRDVLLGLGSAAGLYGVFQIGDRVARVVMPRGTEEIGSIYALRSLRPREEIALRLAAVIGPSEELFWHGLVQQRLAAAVGRWPAAVLSTLAYGGAHIASGNATLVGAAAVAGGYWGLLHAAGLRLPALIVSHIAWDVWIFLVAPTERPTE